MFERWARLLLVAVITVFALTVAAKPANAGPITLTGNPGGSTEDLGNFSGSLTYTSNGAGTAATLTISLTNTSPVGNGGFITAFALNNPGGISGVTEGATFDPAFDVLGGPGFNNGINAQPFGDFDIGAGLDGDTWQGGGAPGTGLGVGETGTFQFDLTGTGLHLLNEQSFVNATTDGQFFVVRFRGFIDGGSDKVPATASTGTTGTGSTTTDTSTGILTDTATGPPALPEPASLALWGVLGVGVALAARHKMAARKATNS